METRVFLKKQETYDAALIEEVLGSVFSELEKDGKLITPGMKVVLKVNLLAKAAPGEAVTTHPAVAEAVARLIIKRGATPIICDSPGGTHSKALIEGIYKASGMKEAAEKSGAVLNEDFSHRDIPLSDAAALLPDVSILNTVLDCDFLISLCKMKTHTMLHYTGAVKNLYGCVPGITKASYHFKFPERMRFSRLITDICETLKPGLSIMDAVTAMEGDGPFSGAPRQMNALLVSKNPHALDLLASHLMNMKMEDVPTLIHAIEDGLCPKSIGELQIIGENPEEFFAKDFKHSKATSVTFGKKVPKFLQNILSSRPKIDKENCVGCGKCKDICPAGAINMKKKKAKILKKMCIRCFCCHEVCPARAIDIKAGLFRMKEKS